MSDVVDVTVQETVDQIDITILDDGDTTNITVEEVIEEVEVIVQDEGTYVPDNVWFNLASGFQLGTTPTVQTTTLPGEVRRYEYLGGAVRYRYKADDNSEDAFYENYTAPGTLITKIVDKQIAP